MAPPDDRDYDYAAEIGALPAWSAPVLIAAVANRVSPAYRVLADDGEYTVYARVVEALWRARGADTAALQALHDDVLAGWPEDEGEMEDLTPYYWKIRVLHVLKAGLQHAARDPVKAVRLAEQTALDVVHDFESRVLQEGLDRPISCARDETDPYSAREFRTFLHDVAVVRQEADPDTAVRRIRELGAAEAELLGRELLALWIRAERWTQADLESAHGAEQNGR